jgi:hypothetical protein
VGLLGLFVVGAAWLGIRTVEVKNELEALVPLARSLETAAEARDHEQLDVIASEAAVHARRAAELTGEPIWALGRVIPVLGANYTAVQTISQQLDAVATTGVGPVLDLLADVEAAGGGGDGLDLSVAERAREPLSSAARAFATADEEVSAIETGGLLPPVGDAVDELGDALTAAAPVVQAAAHASALLPGMLGADEPRTILVMLQNNAELRTGGGITGSFVLLRADDGRVTMVKEADSGDFPVAGAPVVPIPRSTTELYGDVVGRFVQNASMTADFALTARLASTWWEGYTGAPPDAVLSVDPLVIAALLGEFGAAPLPDGSTLTADNVVDRLLVDPYMTLDTSAQTAFQRLVTRSVLSHLLADGIDPIRWATALRSPIEEGRVSLWSAHPEEQEIIARGALAGPSARQSQAGRDAFAVYLNDTTGGKMGTLLDVRTAVDVVECRPDGHRDAVVAVTLKSLAPEDAASRFPLSVTGGGEWGTPPGNIDTAVTVAAPPGSTFGGVTRDGDVVPSADVVDNGHPSSLVTVALAPGEEVTTLFRFVAGEARPLSPRLLTTPLPTEAATDDDFRAACRD